MEEGNGEATNCVATAPSPSQERMEPTANRDAGGGVATHCATPSDAGGGVATHCVAHCATLCDTGEVGL